MSAKSFSSIATAVFVLLFAVSCRAQTPSSQAAAAAQLRVGEHYVDVFATTQALPELNKVVHDFPETHAAQVARYRMAYCHAFEGRHDQARALAQSVIQANPGTVLAVWAQVLIGASCVALGDPTGAIREFAEALAMSSGLSDQSAAFEARARIGQVGLDRSRHHHWSPARALLLDEKNPSDCAWALATLAGAKAQERNFAGALADFEKLRTDYPTSLDDIAWAAGRIGEAGVSALSELKGVAPKRIEEAKALLMLPRSLVPENNLLVSRAEYRLANYLINIERDYDRAVDLLTVTAEDCTDTEFEPLVHYQLGTALRRLARYREAATEFKLVATDFPSSGYASPSLRDRAGCLAAVGEVAEAKAQLMELLASAPERDWQLTAQQEIGKCLLLEGNLDEAAKVIEAASRGLLDYVGRSPVTTSADTREVVRERAAKLAADVASIRKAIAQGGKYR